ncbi:hypothetical protein Anae109_0626 [Anaeromyxobacter sp. Fw109-5]|nr:hypothetical protein Anae109_0626 [Anaeromyxobacter sp. Fw109-5]
MQPTALIVVEVVSAARKHVVERHELDVLALRQVGGLVEDEPSAPHVCLERPHRSHSSLPPLPRPRLAQDGPSGLPADEILELSEAQPG